MLSVRPPRASSLRAHQGQATHAAEHRHRTRHTDDDEARLHLFSPSGILWTAAIVLWWWAMQGAQFSWQLRELLASASSTQHTLLTVALVGIGVATVLLLLFVVAALTEALRYAVHAARDWMGLD